MENWTDLSDVNGVPGHSINVIVDGGVDEAIARVVFDRKPAGTGMLGNTQVSLTDSRGRVRLVRFDRPAMVDCAAYIEVRRKENFAAIKPGVGGSSPSCRAMRSLKLQIRRRQPNDLIA